MTCSPAFATDGTLFFTDGSHVRMSQDRGNTWVSLEGGQILGTGEYWSGISSSQNFATDRQFFIGNNKNGLFAGSIPPVPDTTPPVLTAPGDGTTVPAGAIAIGATDNSGSVTLSYTVTQDGQPVTSGSSETGSITIPATTFSTPGTYTVRVTATDGTNPVTSTFTIIVPVPDIPVPEFPSTFLPATMIIGFLGAVLLIQRTREH